MSETVASATLTRYEAAAYLGVSVDTLDRLRAAQRIPACQVSKRLVKYRQRDLDTYLIECQTSPSSASRLAPTGTSSGTRVDVRAASRHAQQAVRKLKLSSLRSA